VDCEQNECTNWMLVFVGASPKSIGASLMSGGPRDVFSQIHNPDLKGRELCESIFISRGSRAGSTSFNIRDNVGEALQPVSDYGIEWLTNCKSDECAFFPQVVVTANDRLVVLWEVGKLRDAK